MAPSRPNIVWLTLESVRSDHTALLDYERPTTPNLSRIARSDRSSAFPHCFAHARWTPASSASILTGTHLTTHRVGFESGDVRQLPADLATVPELLRHRGYRTGGISSNSYVSSATGLDRGFDRFLWPDRYDALRNLGTVVRFILDRDRYRHSSMDAKRLNLTYDLATDVAKRWLDEFRAAGDPFFLYVHFNTSHHPYRPPHSRLEPFLEAGGLSPEEAIETAASVTENMWSLMARGCPLTTRQRAALHATYDATIAHVDELVGTVFDHLGPDRLDDTVFVVTADHGELFGEQGVLGHNLLLHDGVLNVPMVVHGLDDLVAGEADIVQHIDVMQTILGSAGADSSQFQGVDLREERREAAIAQRGPRGGDLDRLSELDPTFDEGRFHRPLVHAVRSSRFKYLESDDRVELFELPDEGMDVSDHYPRVRDHLSTILSGRRPTIERSLDGRERAEFTDSMREQLRHMGYI